MTFPSPVDRELVPTEAAEEAAVMASAWLWCVRLRRSISYHPVYRA